MMELKHLWYSFDRINHTSRIKLISKMMSLTSRFHIACATIAPCDRYKLTERDFRTIKRICPPPFSPFVCMHISVSSNTIKARRAVHTAAYKSLEMP